MGTQRTIKSRINRFFECVSQGQEPCNRGNDRWLKCAHSGQNRFGAGSEMIRIDTAGGLLKANLSNDDGSLTGA
jgi:hypothetical protein